LTSQKLTSRQAWPSLVYREEEEEEAPAKPRDPDATIFEGDDNDLVGKRVSINVGFP